MERCSPSCTLKRRGDAEEGRGGLSFGIRCGKSVCGEEEKLPSQWVLRVCSQVLNLKNGNFAALPGRLRVPSVLTYGDVFIKWLT